jgi:hypothetical protein
MYDRLAFFPGQVAPLQRAPSGGSSAEASARWYHGYRSASWRIDEIYVRVDRAIADEIRFVNKLLGLPTQHVTFASLSEFQGLGDMDNMTSGTKQPNEAQDDSLLLKIAIVLREDLEAWQRLNVAAFTISGVASQEGAVGEIYRDASDNRYLPMFKDPVRVFRASAEEMARTVERGRARGVAFSIFRRELFNTFNDVDNRAAVAGVAAADLDLVGMAFRADRKIADKVLKGLKLLK